MTKASVARRSGPRDVTYVTLPHNTVAATDRPRRGETIRQFVTRTGWEARGLPVVCARRTGTDMQPILRAEWGRKIKPSDELVFIAMPRGGGAQGGGSRSMAGLAAMIAVIALATVVAGPAGFMAGAGFGKLALAVTSAVIIAGGSALVSHFLSPKPGAEDKSEKDPLSVSFGGNQARPQQPIPVHYGRLKFFPDFASAPWTDFRGKDQVFHGLYSLGVGEFEITEIGFGTTPVWTVAGGTSADFPSFKHEIVGPGIPVTLFPSNVAVSPDVSGQELQTVNEYIGPFIVNAPGTIGKRLAIDLVWPGGAHFTSSSGRVDPVTTSISVQYRYVDGSGVPISTTWVTAANLTYRFLSKVAERRTAIIELPTSGRVQVRAARTNALITTQGTNAVVWSGARLYLEGSETRPHVTLMAMEAVSDKSLSAYGSQQIYVIATRKIPVWTGTEWVDQATQNPIWAAIDLWYNSEYGGGQSRNNVDLPRLAQLADEADTRGDTFNHRFTEEMTVLEAIETALRPMIAQPVYVWDRLSVIRDADERVAPRLLLTDFEIIRGSFSGDWMFQDGQGSDGTIVEYLEEQTWLRAEVSSSGSLADLSHPSRVQVPGVTNRRQATLMARYLAASNTYRRMTVSMEIEAEGKLLRRGDLVVVQTELPQTWGQAFRIDASNVAARSLTFHEAADWTGGPNFYVSIRTPAGLPFGPVKVTQGASPDIAIIDQTDLTAVETQQAMTLAVALARSDTSERPTAAFSEGEPRSLSGLVTRIGNAGEGRFTLDLVRDEPEMYLINDANVPVLPPPPPLFIPAVPGIVSGIRPRVEQDGASLNLYVSWEAAQGAQTYTAQISLIPETTTDPIPESDRAWTTVYPNGYETTFQISGLPDNDHYLRIRGTSGAGANGPWSVVTVTSPGLNLTPTGLGYEVSESEIATTPPVAPGAANLTTGVETTASGEISAWLNAAWGAVTNAYAYDVEIKEGAGNFIGYRTAQPVMRWQGLLPNQAYTVRVRALSRIGSPSGYSADATLTTATKTTAPAAPTGLTAIGGFQNVFLRWILPADRDLAHVEIWEHTADLRASATLVATSRSTSFMRANLPHEATRYYWVRAVNTSGVAGADNATAGVVATTAKIVSADLMDGSVSGTKFASGIEPVSVVSATPAAAGYTGPKVVYNTTDGKLYRYAAGAWTVAVPTTDLSGQITDAQLAAIAASKITGQLTNAQIAGIAAAKLTGQITDTQITDGAISTGKLAAGAVTTAKLTAGAVTANEIAANAVTAAKIDAAAITTAKIAAGAVTAAEIAANTITAGQIASAAIATDELAANAVTALKIAAGSIETDKLAANAVTAAKVAAGTLTANEIAAGTITGDRLNINTSFPATITVGATGVTIGTVQMQAADPAARVNAFTTTIDPGKVLISGATTLASWRNGTDATKIEGGSIAANTVTSNKMAIGLRGIDVAGLEFSYVKATNVLSWTAGSVSYVNDAGTKVTVNVIAGSITWTTGTVYVAWAQGATSLVAATTPYSGDTHITFATYRGGNNLVANYGRTIIDGPQILTGSVTADRMLAGTITAASGIIADAAITTAKIADAQITTAKIGDAQVNTLKIGANQVTLPMAITGIAGVTLTTSFQDMLNLTVTFPVATKVILGGSGSMVNAGTAGIDYALAIYRDTTELWSTGARSFQGVASPALIDFQETVAAGTYTYYLKARTLTATTNVTFRERFFMLMGAMR